jgi:hypothetical protein
VLSTGRCGTKLLTHMLRRSSELDVSHRPVPELVYAGRLAYERPDDARDGLSLVAVATRYESVKASYLDGGQYVETNNRITFFARPLATVFESARFIHLMRHPGAFVRSGLRRRYYQGSRHDEGRITPCPSDPWAERWPTLTALERVGWLWNATNAFVEQFKGGVDAERVLTVRAEDLFHDPAVAVGIFEFLQVEPPPRRVIRRLLARPVNVQRDGDWPSFDRWPEEDRCRLRAVAPLADRYGYEL